jgi:hypothetical protein
MAIKCIRCRGEISTKRHICPAVALSEKSKRERQVVDEEIILGLLAKMSSDARKDFISELSIHYDV